MAQRRVETSSGAGRAMEHPQQLATELSDWNRKLSRAQVANATTSFR